MSEGNKIVFFDWQFKKMSTNAVDNITEIAITKYGETGSGDIDFSHSETYFYNKKIPFILGVKEVLEKIILLERGTLPEESREKLIKDFFKEHSQIFGYNG